MSCDFILLNGSTVFSGNSAVLLGGGIAVWFQSVLVGNDIQFLNNGVLNGTGGSGGGLFCAKRCKMQLQKVYFEQNTADFGAAIKLSMNSLGTISDIIVTNHQTITSGTLNVKLNCSLSLSGKNTFTLNTAQGGSAISIDMANISMTGQHTS